MYTIKFIVFSAFITIAFAANCLEVVTDFDYVQEAADACSDLIIRGIDVPAGETLEINLQDGATLTFEGTIRFGVANWTGPLLKITGHAITVNGAAGAVLDGQGASYWDTLGEWGTLKPKFFRIEATGGSLFSNIQIRNCPMHCTLINDSDDVLLVGWNIDVSAGDEYVDGNVTARLGHNTDGFNIYNSSFIEIRDTNVFNQDDCIAVQRGTNMIFSRMYCSGGHGLSMSVGWTDDDQNIARDIEFVDSTIVNSMNAIHLKTHTDAGTGEMSNIIYRNIQFSGSTNFGINVQEDYSNGESTGTPKANIPIRNLIFDNVRGDVDSTGIGVYIMCAEDGCLNWRWYDVNVTGQGQNICNYEPSGFTC